MRLTRVQMRQIIATIVVAPQAINNSDGILSLVGKDLTGSQIGTNRSVTRHRASRFLSTMGENSMMKLATTILGALILGTALIGFMNHEFMSMALNNMHNIFLLIVGAVSLYFGIRGTEYQARNMNRVLGVMFTLLGAATLMAGPGHTTIDGVNIVADHVLKLITGQLEYTTADGVRDLSVGLVGLVTGFMPREKEIEVDMKAAETQQKVGSGR
jgi:hypothetical protein